MSRERGERGFILVEAMVATAILGFSGSVILVIGNGAMTRANADLDRAVALLTLEGLVVELRLVGSVNAAKVLPYEQGELRYDMLPGADAGLRLAAFDAGSPGDPILILDLTITERSGPGGPL